MLTDLSKTMTMTVMVIDPNKNWKSDGMVTDLNSQYTTPSDISLQ